MLGIAVFLAAASAVFPTVATDAATGAAAAAGAVPPAVAPSAAAVWKERLATGHKTAPSAS